MNRQLQLCTGVSWTIESAGVLVIPSQVGSPRLLGPLESVAWDLISRGNSISQTISKLSMVDAMEEAESMRVVHAFLSDWQTAGWLTEGGCCG